MSLINNQDFFISYYNTIIFTSFFSDLDLTTTVSTVVSRVETTQARIVSTTAIAPTRSESYGFQGMICFSNL